MSVAKNVPRSESVYACFWLAIVSVSPIPWPVSMYQEPFGSIPAASQIDSSFVFVPDSSARDANGASAFAMLVKASAAEPAPLIPAGSSSGPTTMKSLCMTALRLTP